MNQHKLHKLFSFIPVIIGLFSMITVMTSCSDDDEELRSVYGYAQFKVCKTSSLEGGAASRTVQLDRLDEAKKIKVVLQNDGKIIESTTNLNAFDSESAEYGLKSDKVQLVAGGYEVIGFYLFDKLNNEIYSGNATEGASEFEVVSGGLNVQTLAVDAVSRGRVEFRLFKEVAKARSSEETYNFAAIRSVSVKVKNLFTQEKTTIKNLRVKYVEDFTDHSADQNLYGDKHSLTSYGQCDSLVWLKSGSYQVVEYTTYSDTRASNVLGNTVVPTAKTFVVKDNQVTRYAEVPVQMSEYDENIKDYIALKQIWESLDGPNWSYDGETEHPGTNWNFNKDIDMWGDQPGVQLDSRGRVATISLDGMGAKGVVPDAIGQLTELSILSLGSHSEKIGGHLFEGVSANTSAEKKREMRYDYFNRVLARDFRESLSEMWQKTINMNPDEKPIKSNRISTKGIQFGDLTNQITGISRAMMRLTNLEQFFIANSPITSENFFVDIKEDSPFYVEREELSWKNLNKLVDMEIYNCPKLTSLPVEMFDENGLPELQMLNISCSKGISGDVLRQNWIDIINGNSGDKIQILYMGFNNLEEFPEYEDLNKMRMLGMLDCTNNKVHTLHPFGKEVNLVNLVLDYNQITEVPKAADGFFCGYNDVESFSMSNNKIKKFPNIFNAKSVFVMKSVNFSYNQLDGFEGEDDDTFKGVNCSQLDLKNNNFTKFPSVLFKTNSPLNYLVLAGNKISKINDGDLKGKNSKLLEALDMSYNRLTKLSKDFTQLTLPSMSGIELSYNCFSEFPMTVLGLPYLQKLFIRNQRDADGNRCLKEWPVGLYTCPSMVFFCIGSNDIRKVEDTISPYIRFFEIKDNPNISIDLSGVCNYIKAGLYELTYDKTQDIRGCDILDIEK